MAVVITLLVCLMTMNAAYSSHVSKSCPVLASHVNTSCTIYCCCTVDGNNRTYAKCNIRGMDPLSMKGIRLPHNLSSLDLSSNGLEEIPAFLQKFSAINYLSLANNSLHNNNFALKTLQSLKQLRTLDISYTDIRLLYRNRIQYLPNLEKLIVKDSHIAHPRYWRHMFSLPKIRQVVGVSWARSCDKCNVSKVDDYNAKQEPPRDHTKASKLEKYDLYTQDRNNLSPKVKMSYTAEDSYGNNADGICWFDVSHKMFQWFTHYSSPRDYLKSGYKLECVCDSRDCTTKSPLNPIGIIFRLLQRLFDCLYPLGSIAAILNLTVIIVILTSKTLRKSPTMALVVNMAVCDLLLSVYCMLIATFNAFLKSDEEIVGLKFDPIGFIEQDSQFKTMCHPNIFIFTVAQIVSVTTSILLTVEKYLAIVFSMKPDVRVTRKISLISLCVAWFVAIAYSVDAVFFLSEFEESYNDFAFNYYYCATSGHHVAIKLGIDGQQEERPIAFSVILSFCYTFLFLCTIPLYIHIYIVVKKSSTQMGVRRDGALAKKLAFLVFSNLIFSAIPLSFTPVASSRNVFALDFFRPVLRTYNSFQAFIISVVWLPVLLLSLNSCLNPLLFAFRHSRFKTQFRQNVIKALECLRRKED